LESVVENNNQQNNSNLNNNSNNSNLHLHLSAPSSSSSSKKLSTRNNHQSKSSPSSPHHYDIPMMNPLLPSLPDIPTMIGTSLVSQSSTCPVSQPSTSQGTNTTPSPSLSHSSTGMILSADEETKKDTSS
jgi:hypothetical protein